ncbi:MAG: hypothetical protein EOM40_11105 [Clostridia bacterium]|nr:hypothetical protein [Clostridia bacterium]NCC42061.1 hypothetical protein [Clostridia bacterium]
MLIFTPDNSLYSKLNTKFKYFKNLKDDVILYGESNPREVLDLYLEGIEIFDKNAQLLEIKLNREKISELEDTLAEMGTALAERDNVLVMKDNVLAEREAEIAKLKALLEKIE